MSTDKKKFENVKEGMMTQGQENPQSKLRSASKKLEKVIEKKHLQDLASTTFDNNGLHIEFKEGVLFSSGAAEFSVEHQKTIKEVIKIISDLGSDYQLVIEGHTDDVPLHSKEVFESNWELSAARGFAMMRWFQSMGIPENHMSVLSYAHTRPKIDPKGLKGAELQKARAANRRVLIRIE